MGFVPICKCRTSQLREELVRNHLSSDGTRTQLLRRLREHDVTLVFEPEPLRVLEPETTRVLEPVFTVEKEREYNPISPYIPITSLERSGNLLTDAAFSIINCTHIRSVETLQVANVDILTEIEDIRTLKKQLVEDYLLLKRDLEHVRHTLENTFNHDMYMYNVAKDVTWNDYTTYIHGDFEVIDSHFFGKVEDSTIHANMHFEIIKPGFGNTDTFTIDLPADYDARLVVCPVMVLVNSNYEANVGYLSESTQCHAYIHRDNPRELKVFCPVLRDSYTRLQFDITLRYFCLVDPAMITPVRVSSMWYMENLTEREHRAYHHWTLLEDRVELFTNVELFTEMNGIDTIDVRLPVPCSEHMDVVGYGVIHYTIHGSNVIYSSNTPLVRISQNNATRMQIKSALMLNVNNYNTMRVATHVVYSRKIDTQLIHDFKISNTFVKVGSRVFSTFRTTVPVNVYYFKHALAVTESPRMEYEIPLTNINGLQSIWNIYWEVPEALSNMDSMVRFEIRLYDSVYTTENSTIVSDALLLPENIFVSIDQIGPHDISLWIDGFDTTYVVPYTVFVYANDDLHAEFYERTKDSEKIFVHLTRLFHDTIHNVTIRFTDPVGSVTDKILQIRTANVDIRAPLFYSIVAKRESDVIVASAVLSPSSGNFTWYVFLSHHEIEPVTNIISSLTPNNDNEVSVRLNTLYNGEAIDFEKDIFVYFVSFYVPIEDYNIQMIRLIVGNF